MTENNRNGNSDQEIVAETDHFCLFSHTAACVYNVGVDHSVTAVH